MIIHAIHVLTAAQHERAKRSGHDPRTEARRSSKWEHLEREIVAERKTCAACGGSLRLQVHHVAPFHLRRDLELVPSNLIVLCMGAPECHLRLGHPDGWKSWNPRVVEHAAESLARPLYRSDIAVLAKLAAMS